MTTEKESLAELVKVLHSIDSEELMLAFLKDMCTPQELRSMGERWKIANMVNEGVPYRKIGEILGAGTATVTRVSRALTEGSGYKRVIEVMEKSS